MEYTGLPAIVTAGPLRGGGEFVHLNIADEGAQIHAMWEISR